MIGKSETELKFDKAVRELDLLAQATSLPSANQLIRMVQDENFMLTGTVKVGKSKTELEVLFDTGSDWMAIYSGKCKNCNGKYFNPKTSKKVSRES